MPAAAGSAKVLPAARSGKIKLEIFPSELKNSDFLFLHPFRKLAPRRWEGAIDDSPGRGGQRGVGQDREKSREKAGGCDCFDRGNARQCGRGDGAGTPGARKKPRGGFAGSAEPRNSGLGAWSRRDVQGGTVCGGDRDAEMQDREGGSQPKGGWRCECGGLSTIHCPRKSPVGQWRLMGNPGGATPRGGGIGLTRGSRPSGGRGNFSRLGGGGSGRDRRGGIHGGGASHAGGRAGLGCRHTSSGGASHAREGGSHPGGGSEGQPDPRAASDACVVRPKCREHTQAWRLEMPTYPNTKVTGAERGHRHHTMQDQRPVFDSESSDSSVEGPEMSHHRAEPARAGRRRGGRGAAAAAPAPAPGRKHAGNTKPRNVSDAGKTVSGKDRFKRKKNSCFVKSKEKNLTTFKQLQAAARMELIQRKPRHSSVRSPARGSQRGGGAPLPHSQKRASTVTLLLSPALHGSSAAEGRRNGGWRDAKSCFYLYCGKQAEREK